MTADLTNTAESSSFLNRVLRNMAFHEFVALGFHSLMLLRAAGCPPSDDRTMALRFGAVLWTVTLTSILSVRGGLWKPGKVRALFYRLGVFAPVVVSYFQMMFLLPALQTPLMDTQLFAIDQAFLGTTPALWFQRFNQQPVVEWIAFFYYSYFYLMAGMLLPTLFFDKGQRMRELMIGGVIVATTGHTLYTLMPGAGPYATIEFAQPLNGGLFWGLVVETVSSAGAQLDIFPSLHTAYPTLFALHAFGNRDRAPFKYVWPVIAFFAINMIIATMFLRWHWAIDVVAGLALAFTARAIAVRVARREGARGQDGDDRQVVWEPLFGKKPTS